ncbi:hypothetical protein Tco_0698340 [Tanacetum coccineum]
MARATTISSSSSNGDDGITRQYVDDAMAEIKQALTTRESTITTLSIQNNQVVTNGTGRQANQFNGTLRLMMIMLGTIEAMVKKQLKSGVIKHGQSSIASPVVMAGFKCLINHVQHLANVLSKMKSHSLFAKESRCVFGTTHVEYFGHVISVEGVATDPTKVQAIQSWQIPTNVKQLKGFLGSLLQLKWFPKLMGFDYEVIYKKRVDNIAADALSRREYVSEFLSMNTITMRTELYKKVLDSWKEDEKLKAIVDELKLGKQRKHYSLHDDQLLRKRKLAVRVNEFLRKELLSYFHEGANKRHYEVKTTTHKKLVKECLICQKCKPYLSSYLGLV